MKKLNTLATNGYTAQGETKVTGVVARRADAVTVDVDAVNVSTREANLRPIVADQPNVVQRTTDDAATTHEIPQPP